MLNFILPKRQYIPYPKDKNKGPIGK